MQTTQRQWSKILKHRGNDFEIFSKSKSELNPKDGTIEEITDRDNKIVGYAQKFNSVSGYIDDVIVQKRHLKRGDKTIREYEIDVHIDSGGEKAIIRLGFDQGGGRDFATTFRNINLKKQVTFYPWQLKPKDGQNYGKVGISFCEGVVWDKQMKYEKFYDKDYQEEQGLDFNKKSRGETKFDKDAFADWLYDNFIKDIYYEFKHYDEKPQEKPDDRDDDRGGSSRGRDDDRSREDRGRDESRGRDNDRGRDRADDYSSSRGRDHMRDRDQERGRGRERDDDKDRGRDRDDDRGSERGRSRDDERSSGGDRNYRTREDAPSGRDNSRNTGRDDDERDYSNKDDDDDLPF